MHAKGKINLKTGCGAFSEDIGRQEVTEKSMVTSETWEFGKLH